MHSPIQIFNSSTYLAHCKFKLPSLFRYNFHHPKYSQVWLHFKCKKKAKKIHFLAAVLCHFPERYVDSNIVLEDQGLAMVFVWSPVEYVNFSSFLAIR